MNKKDPLIIAVDMDGTLLNSKKKICLKTLFLLRKLTKQGHKIILSSGRPVRGLIPYYKKLKLSTPLICYNGEHVFSPVDNNFVPKSITFNKDMLLDITNELGKEAINIMCETDDEIWITKEDMFLNRFFYYKNMNLHEGELKNILNKDTFTYICKTSWDFRETNMIQSILKKYKDIINIDWIGSPYFELHHKNINKGSALKYIAEFYKIPKENIIAFGDSTNDVEMFDNAGISIIMKNGKDTVKNADYISDKDNDHNGIYYMLKKILKSY